MVLLIWNIRLTYEDNQHITSKRMLGVTQGYAAIIYAFFFKSPMLLKVLLLPLSLYI